MGAVQKLLPLEQHEDRRAGEEQIAGREQPVSGARHGVERPTRFPGTADEEVRKNACRQDSEPGVESDDQLGQTHLGDQQTKVQQAHRQEDQTEMLDSRPDQCVRRFENPKHEHRADIPDDHRRAPQQEDAVKHRAPVPRQHKQNQREVDQRGRERND